MRTVGIIAEFNPFHKGHQYILEKAKAHTDCQRAMVVMSGSFVQRGEPAFFDKWTRAKCALLNGADMVLELPVLFAAANAEIFAMGGVKVLEDTGMTNALCFGSESGDLKALQEAAKIMTNETEEFQRLLKAGLDEGMSYPAARAKALETVSHISSEIISRPNHILGLEYLKALDRLGSNIKPCTIRRKGSQYDDPSLTGEFASAAAIRKGILEENATEAFLQVPENIVDLLTKEISLGTAPASMDKLAGALHYKLRTTSAEEIHDILEVTEGLENRILRAIDNEFFMNDIIEYIKTKRYTRTKIQRILVHILLDIQAKEVDYFLSQNHLPYIRVLGFQKDNADILGELTEQAKCPVLTNLKKAPEILDEDGLHLLALEKLATDLQALAAPNPLYRAPNRDFTTPMAIV